MTAIRSSYVSECCGHEYVEQRAKDEPMYFPTCNACGNDDYKLITETILSEPVDG